MYLFSLEQFYKIWRLDIHGKNRFSETRENWKPNCFHTHAHYTFLLNSHGSHLLLWWAIHTEKCLLVSFRVPLCRNEKKTNINLLPTCSTWPVYFCKVHLTENLFKSPSISKTIFLFFTYLFKYLDKGEMWILPWNFCWNPAFKVSDTKYSFFV